MTLYYICINPRFSFADIIRQCMQFKIGQTNGKWPGSASYRKGNEHLQISLSNDLCNYFFDHISSRHAYSSHTKI